jgi:phosphoribosylaminoimidazolecarboxamide formyltransferase / IMP cyclohydrolase
VTDAPEIPLRYGCNPHQQPARLVQPGGRAPLRVLNGEASYINVLDALTGWQLVRELAEVTGKAAAASFKHVSPAGAAVAGPVSDAFARSQFLSEPPRDPVTQAYVRARGADRMSSFGDACAVSQTVTAELAAVLKGEVSDLVIAPAYESGALEILRSKRRGSYLVLQIDPEYLPDGPERRDVSGFTLEQSRASAPIRPELFQPRDGPAAPESVVETMVVATTALKYTQSNSVCVAYEGQVIGMAAGQQSRIHATRIACDKAEKWMLQTHPKVLELRFPPGLPKPERANAVDQYVLWDRLSRPERDALSSTLGYTPEPLTDAERSEWYGTFEGLCLSSDAFIPFRDNVDRAAATGVRYVAHPGGALRHESVAAAAREHGITVFETGVRCFFH